MDKSKTYHELIKEKPVKDLIESVKKLNLYMLSETLKDCLNPYHHKGVVDDITNYIK